MIYVIISTQTGETMINLDERYHDYLTNNKTLRIDGISERLQAYGWHCDGNDIKGYYLTTENYKLYYNLNEQFIKMEPLRKVAVEA
tara:strand:+ start:49 stop:306 length:258 start_codon:yes stop_codon:yes gene_type:complete